MPAPTGAFVYRDADLTMNAVDYSNQHWRARLVPDTPIVTQRTAVPDGTIVDIDNPVWTLELTAAQINVTGGLAKALRDATPGTEWECTLQPTGGQGAVVGSPFAEFTVKTLPVPFGGTVGQLADVEIVLPVVGQPIFDEVEAP